MPLSSLQPLWDEALAGLLYEEYSSKQRALDILDLQALALENATRIGDIMETMFLMAIYGEWVYKDESGEIQQLDQKNLDELYSKGRISADDLKAFSGVWAPAE